MNFIKGSSDLSVDKKRAYSEDNSSYLVSQKLPENDEPDNINMKKKRKRNTVVCLSCKKRKIKCDRGKPCGQCIQSNASNFCFYSSPQWALDSFLATSKGGSADEANQLTGLNGSPNNSSTGTLHSNFDSVNRGFVNDFTEIEKMNDSKLKIRLLYKHLNEVQSAIQKLQNSDKIHMDSKQEEKTFLSTIQLHDINQDHQILLNFHASFNSLEIKRSSDISCKPITTSALISKDPFIGLIFKYYHARTINRKLLKNCYPGEKKTRGHESNISHSVLDMIKINDDKIPPPKSILDKKQKNNTILNLSALITSADGKDKESIKREILKGLVDVPVVYLRKYLINFWNFVYPVIPILDREEFEANITRILGIDIMNVKNDDTEIKISQINLTQTFDLINVAIFLILIRFSYLSIIAQLKLKTTDRNLLKHFKVPTTFFNLANSCLSAYKPFRKSKIILLQFLTLVKSYSLFSVEDGEGNDLNQGIVLKNIVAILVKMMGMNKDPIHNIEVFKHVYGDESDKKTYVWRKLFWVIVSLDHKTSSLSGLLSNFNIGFISKFCDTDFPEPLPHFPNAKLEKGICEFLKKTNKVSLFYTKIIDSTSGVNDFTTLGDFLKDLEIMDNKLDENECVLSNMKKLNISNYTKDIEELDYESFTTDILTTSLANCTIIELNLLNLNLQMSSYHSVLILLESQKQACSQKTLTLITLKLMSVIQKITDICHMYLNHEYRDYIVKGDFHLNRLVQLTVEKCCLILAATALKVCFIKPTIDKDELVIRKQTFHNCLLVMNEMGSLLFNSCGIKYYQGYKSLINLRFIFKLLNYYPFESTSMAMIHFFYSFYNLLQAKTNESDVETQNKIKDLFKKNAFLKGVLLESTLSEFMTKWQSIENGEKVFVQNSEFNNSLDNYELLVQINKTLLNFKSIKEQLFEFNLKNSNSMSASNKRKQPGDLRTSIDDLSKNLHTEVDFDHGNNEKKSGNHIPNFTIITEHSTRNILNDPPMKEINNFALNENKVAKPYKNTHQIPSLLGDEKIVKYLIPGLNYEDKNFEESFFSESNDGLSDAVNEIGNYNDAMMNYGLDVLFGENELLPDDDPFLSIFK
ncbi:hypothetical protein QEN19_001049 [Hanseniaspora menglaensis]